MLGEILPAFARVLTSDRHIDVFLIFILHWRQRSMYLLATAAITSSCDNDMGKVNLLLSFLFMLPTITFILLLPRLPCWKKTIKDVQCVTDTDNTTHDLDTWGESIYPKSTTSPSISTGDLTAMIRYSWEVKLSRSPPPIITHIVVMNTISYCLYPVATLVFFIPTPAIRI